MGRVGILTRGRLSPEPRFTLPPCSRTGPRGWERGSVLRGWGLLGRGGPGSGAAASDQAGKEAAGTHSAPVGRPLSASNPARGRRSPLRPPPPRCPGPDPWPNAPAASRWKKAPGGKPSLRERLEGQGGKWRPSLWAYQWPGHSGQQKASIFSLAQDLGLVNPWWAPLPSVLPHVSLPAWSSRSQAQF